jgi:hypothetical protein
VLEKATKHLKKVLKAVLNMALKLRNKTQNKSKKILNPYSKKSKKENGQ